MMTRLGFLGSWLAALPFTKKEKKLPIASFTIDVTNDMIEQLNVQLINCSLASYGDDKALAINPGEYAWSEALSSTQQLNCKYRALNARVEKLREIRDKVSHLRSTLEDPYLQGRFDGLTHALMRLDGDLIDVHIDCSGFKLDVKRKGELT